MRLLRRYGKLVVQVMPDHYLAKYGSHDVYEYFVRSIDGSIKRACSPTWYPSMKAALRYAKDDYSDLIEAQCLRSRQKRVKFSRWELPTHRRLKLRAGHQHPARM